MFYVIVMFCASRYLGKMYAGKSLVHLNDLVGGQKQFNLENDFVEKMSDIKDTQPVFSSVEDLKTIMKYNSLITDILAGKEDAHTKISKLRRNPCISSKIK